MNKQVIKITEQDLHNIVKQTIKQIVKENNYKNKFNKIRAAAYKTGKDSKYAQNVINNMLAKQTAITDINKDINTKGNKIKKTQWDGIQSKKSYDDYNDYFVDSNNKFINPIKYSDLNITPEEGEDLLTINY